MLTCQKSLFSLSDADHYLNCAYMAPLSKAVEAAGIEGLIRKRRPALFKVDDFFDEADAVRERFGALIHAAPQHIAIIPSASYGIATAARNLPIERGQTIILAHEQFPSNVYVWQRLAQEKGAEVQMVAPPEGPNRGQRWNERLLDAIDNRTAVVSLGNVHWADGTRFDLVRIGQRAREVGAAFVIDGTQSVGALPFDTTQIQPDAVICAGYKWLLGPYNIGLAYFGPCFDNGVPLEENWITRKNSEDFAGLVRYQPDYQPGAVRYDMGERAHFTHLPMLQAALDHLLSWTPRWIQSYCQQLTAPLLADADALGITVEDAAWRGEHMFGLRLPPHVSVETLKANLSDRNISVSVRGDALRISIHVFNESADIDALRAALHAALQPATA